MERRLPRCYGLTFSTYGTRLLGDQRGSTRWDGTRVEPSVPLEEYMLDNLNAEPFTMTDPLRGIVHDAIINSAYKRRLCIDALNVRKTHVHVVVCSLEGLSEEEAMSFIKYDAGLALEPFLRNRSSRRIWTKSFAKTNFSSIGHWRTYVRYVLLEQGSNAYMTRTKFARRVGLTECNDPKALSAAFQIEKNASFRRCLFTGMNAERLEDAMDDER